MKKSFDGWEFWKFVKGRRRLALGAVGYALGLLVSDSQLVGALSAGIIEIVWGLGEYYYTK
jgi:hypothetical protein